MSDVVNKLWGFCHTLGDDGIDYGDYIEQLTYLMFLKMAHEKDIDLSGIQYEEDRNTVTLDCSWTPSSKSPEPAAGRLCPNPAGPRPPARPPGDIFTQAVPRFTNPVNLKKIINMIDEEDWSSMEVDVKGAAFEDCLKNPPPRERRVRGSISPPGCSYRPSLASCAPTPGHPKDSPSATPPAERPAS
jgi:type I restriction enzyme M protein